MHFTTISAAACLVAMASATNHAHHFHMRRQLNATVPSTTLTVFATETKTILSCAKIVTDCPAHPEQATSEVVVTVTKAISTTICPVADASSISSAIASGTAGTSATPAAPAVPAAPLTTGASSPVTKSVKDAGVTDTVLTYTLGTGTSTTVVTTTIKHTETKTVYATPTSGVTSEETDEESSGPGQLFETNPSSTGDLSGQGGEPTTTLSSTSTKTKYITVYPAPSGVNAAGSGSGSGSGGDCAAVAPVTVTVAVSTVTVATTITEKAAAICPTTEAPLAVASATSAQDGIAASQSTDVIVVPTTATLIPIPASSGAPYGNGTIPSGVAPSAGVAAPTTVLPTGGYAYKA